MPPKKKVTLSNQKNDDIDNSMYGHYVKVLNESIQKYGQKTIVFYQCGSFFELYNLQDKNTQQNRFETVEEFCELTGMTMSCNKKTEWNNFYVVLAGFPEHSCEKFIKLAIQNGYTALIYIQSKNPINKQREYFMTYSPGTYLSYDTENSQQLTNNIMCIWLEGYQPFDSIKRTKQMVCGISASHIFTGETAIFQYDTPFYMNPTTFDELERAVSSINPSEIIFISNLEEDMVKQISQFSGIYTCSRKTHFLSIQGENQKQILENCQKQTYISHMISLFYGQEAYESCSEFYEYLIATQSFCYLLHFLQEHNPDLIKKIAFPKFNNVGNRLILANHTLKQLNIIDDDTLDGKNAGKFSSVLSFLNKCITPMGKRKFQQQMINPTFDIEWIQNEYDATERAIQENFDIRPRLRKIRDLDKICRQIVTKRVYPHSIFTLYDSIQSILSIFCDISPYKDTIEYLCGSDGTLKETICSFLQYIDSVFYIDRCKGVETTTIFMENIIKPGISSELDQISQQYHANITLFDSIKKVLNDMMCESEQVVNGDFIKVHSTEKSGNTLQITRKRGQTLRKILDKAQIIDIIPGFRILAKDIQFIKTGASNDEIDFPQLTHLLKQIGCQKDRLSSEISRIYFEVLSIIEENWYLKIEQIISFITRVDVLQCKTYIAQEYNYCKPTIDRDVEKQSYIKAAGIRHVLIEHLQKNEIYVTNDIELGIEKNGILLFGTNAVGKTSFIRAIGILIIMAQCGLYVPCSTFHYLPYRSIFSRILGNDNLFKGLSTFAVEMSELRVILKMADSYSLVLGDELCSGTEIESALSLFSMGLIDLHKKGSTFLFATHFHEITQYEEIQSLEKLDIKHMAVHYDPANQCLIYDRKLSDGQGSRTYGLEVCKSLFLEEDFLERAYQFRQKYFRESGGELMHATSRYNMNKIKGFCENCKTALAEETHHLSPQKNADEKGFIGSFHKDHPANLMALCEACHLSLHKQDVIIVKKKSIRGINSMKV